MENINSNPQPQSHGEVLRETMQEEFPLLSEVTAPFMENPLKLMTAITIEQGEEMDMKPRTVKKHLRTLCTKGYVEHVKHGVYCKVPRKRVKIKQAA